MRGEARETRQHNSVSFGFSPRFRCGLLPISFSDLRLILLVTDLVAERDCPHLLFYGPPGSGKKTLIITLICQIFGPSTDKVKVENKTWKVDAGSRTIDIELTTLSSNNHFELNPSDAGFQDRYIVQEIIKEIAKNRPFDTKGKKGYQSRHVYCSKDFVR